MGTGVIELSMVHKILFALSLASSTVGLDWGACTVEDESPLAAWDADAKILAPSMLAGAAFAQPTSAMIVEKNVVLERGMIHYLVCSCTILLASLYVRGTSFMNVHTQCSRDALS